MITSMLHRLNQVADHQLFLLKVQLIGLNTIHLRGILVPQLFRQQGLLFPVQTDDLPL